MRARKHKKNGTWIAAAGVGSVVLLAAFLFSGVAGSLLPHQGLDKFGAFSPDGFIENPKTYAGNKYRVVGTLDNILDSGNTSDGVARLVSLAVDGGKFIPVLVPAKSASFALQRGQGVVAYCSINPVGLPVAESIEKK